MKSELSDAEKIKIAEGVVDVLTMKIPWYNRREEKLFVVDVLTGTMDLVAADDIEAPVVSLGPVSVVLEWIKAVLPLAIEPDEDGPTDETLLAVYELIIKEARDEMDRYLESIR